MLTIAPIWKPAPAPRQPSAYELQQAEIDRAICARAAAKLEAEATKMADRFDMEGLCFQVNRWSFGSLSAQWDAAKMRRVYYRAIEIKGERSASILIAAK